MFYAHSQSDSDTSYPYILLKTFQCHCCLCYKACYLVSGVSIIELVKQRDIQVNAEIPCFLFFACQ